ncbi:hypothetical protein F2P56_023145 [Juglans regia]|uniref:Epidermal patterning factor-like protein n=2 Tax=Juglans regia TaxID=51240 RepID=A0A2I4HW20_JUGRE|nr:EPIDERMAL PATTERNING FACTOR-like protein 8 isoform X1 [Juglans regia]KAF5459166.1 hypothetical protein F2P56_023145 [Juglans regia]
MSKSKQTNKTRPTITSTVCSTIVCIASTSNKLPNSSANFHVPFFYLKKKGLMASSRRDLNGLKIAVIVMLFFSLEFFSSKSAASMLPRDRERLKQMKLVLGSRPPRCVNKCLNCRPCTAALIASPHHKTDFNVSSQPDESYYLLSWKCKCKDKFFQP